jgi:hypothetical protein
MFLHVRGGGGGGIYIICESIFTTIITYIYPGPQESLNPGLRADSWQIIPGPPGAISYTSGAIFLIETGGGTVLVRTSVLF